MIRCFVDSNGDGTGDLGGLASRLDYLQWLGIDALWLPPFYMSPMRDGGDDVSDFKAGLPEVGTIDEVRDLVRPAPERNKRIVIDFPPNPTPDPPHWVPQNRGDPEGPY